tara:strand:- start:473 stop:628 length:156 start_codon:yes stop_codon:yes gene_type:complete
MPYLSALAAVVDQAVLFLQKKPLMVFMTSSAGDFAMSAAIGGIPARPMNKP